MAVVAGLAYLEMAMIVLSVAHSVVGRVLSDAQIAGIPESDESRARTVFCWRRCETWLPPTTMLAMASAIIGIQ